VSVASDSFLSLDSDDDDTMVDQWKASKHGQLKDVQQSISSLLLEMVVGVGNSYCAVITTAIEQSAAKVSPLPPLSSFHPITHTPTNTPSPPAPHTHSVEPAPAPALRG
jgi:hypothetical protein